MFLRLVSVATIVLVLSGCAYTNTTFRSLKKTDGAQLFVWHPDYSAGVGRENRLCVQGARTATASNLSAAIDIVKEAEAGLGYSEAVKALNPSNAQVSFASNALFSICQLHLNGALNAKQVEGLARAVLSASLKIDTGSGVTSDVTAPDVVNVVDAVVGSQEGADDPEGEDIPKAPMPVGGK